MLPNPPSTAAAKPSSMKLKPSVRSTTPSGARSTPATPASADDNPKASIDSQLTGTPHSLAVSRSTAVARSWRPNCVRANSRMVAVTMIAVATMISTRWYAMLAPATSSTSPFSGLSRYFGVVPCHRPMNARSTRAAPSVVITITWIDRPRSGAYASRSRTMPITNMMSTVTT